MVILKRIHWTFSFALVLAALDDETKDNQPANVHRESEQAEIINPNTAGLNREPGQAVTMNVDPAESEQAKKLEEMRLEALETEYVQNFGNTGKAVVWSLIKYAYDFQKMVKICDDVKPLRGVTARMSNVSRFQGTLAFRKEGYKSRTIDILGCKIANTKFLPVERQYLYVTRGKVKNSLYLLTKVDGGAPENDRYYLYKYKDVEEEPKKEIEEEDEDEDGELEEEAIPPGAYRTIWAPEL